MCWWGGAKGHSSLKSERRLAWRVGERKHEGIRWMGEKGKKEQEVLLENAIMKSDIVYANLKF